MPAIDLLYLTLLGSTSSLPGPPVWWYLASYARGIDGRIYCAEIFVVYVLEEQWESNLTRFEELVKKSFITAEGMSVPSCMVFIKWMRITITEHHF